MGKYRTIQPIDGLGIFPLGISSLGIVSFTDGTNLITPNQSECEAYGYTYDKVTGTCSTFRVNTNLDIAFSNLNNSISGSGNITETGTNNTYIMGENNIVKGFSREQHSSR